MASKQSPRSSAGSSRKADDFTVVRGIGPTLAGRLHEAGILTYSQLASVSPDQLAAKISGLTAKHISNQNWIGQARKLAHQKSQLKSRKREKEPPTPRQHYENFTIEYLFNNKKEVRRTRVIHVQSGSEDSWAGWQTDRLNDFLLHHTHVRNPVRTLPPKTIDRSGREVSQNGRVESGSQVVETHEPNSPSSGESPVNRDPPANELLAQDPPARIVSDFTGSLRLTQLEVVTTDSHLPIFALREGQPYILRLTLDHRAVVTPKDTPLTYETRIIFKQFNGQDYFMSVTGSLRLSSVSETISLAGISLPQGMYRLHASVRLYSSQTSPEITAFLKGDMLQVC